MAKQTLPKRKVIPAMELALREVTIRSQLYVRALKAIRGVKLEWEEARIDEQRERDRKSQEE